MEINKETLKVIKVFIPNRFVFDKQIEYGWYHRKDRLSYKERNERTFGFY